MNLLNIIKGQERKYWKLEDRLNFINEDINSNRLRSSKEINDLSETLAEIKYRMNESSLKKIIADTNKKTNYETINSLIIKIETYRNNQYNINNVENEKINEIKEIYNNKQKYYFLTDRLNAIDEKLDNINDNDCSLKDIDSLNEMLVHLTKNSYIKQKSKKDENFSKLKNKIEYKIKKIISNNQENLNKYSKTYFPSEQEIEELKNNQVSAHSNENYDNKSYKKKSIDERSNQKILEPNKNNNNDSNINTNNISNTNYVQNNETLDDNAESFDEKLDLEASRQINKMNKFATYFMAGILGLASYEIGNLFFNKSPTFKTNETTKEIIYEEPKTEKTNYQKKVYNYVDSLAKEFKKELQEKNEEFNNK